MLSIDAVAAFLPVGLRRDPAPLGHREGQCVGDELVPAEFWMDVVNQYFTTQNPVSSFRFK